ncbi:MAG TPA: ComEC/Rec2 family competence protein [Sphingomonas sp.]|nr:ComEC/Rec2 family competence protein [Sphingomonas sp.]
MLADAAAEARSTHPRRRQTRWWAGGLAATERVLEAERDQLALWLPVAFGAGIAAWFVLPDAFAWSAALLAALGCAAAAAAVRPGTRLRQAVMLLALTAAAGLALIWWRAEQVAAPVLAGPAIVRFAARVERVEPLAARDLVRLTLAPVAGTALPTRVRLNLATADVPARLAPGATVSLRGRLVPPPQPGVPGAYDFARVAWFAGIGATGRGFAPVTLVAGGSDDRGVRARLTAHINRRIDGSEGGIAGALATGDDGAIAEADAEAMRRAGLAHLLSVSGLHITAAVAATMLVVTRLLALSPWLALNARLPFVAALAGAGAAIGYTLLTGSEVPTIRSCVAALLVLAALALGREAMTLRLVAVGAIVVLVAWPEALAGPSFQLSFAAITAIVAIHDHPRIKALFAPHDEVWSRRLLRGVAALLLTGVVVEVALMPIAVFHFHKAGIYGAAANIVAIPLTTFVIMPLEAAALALDLAGMGAPLWWLTEHAIALLLALAHLVAAAPGSVAALPAMPGSAFAAMVAGGLWLALWRTRWRRAGVVPLAAGALWALLTPAPDILVTGDGRHVAVRTAAGLAILRDRAGDYTRSMLAENGGADGEPLLLAEQPDARCSRDLCLVDLVRSDRRWRVLALRSGYAVPMPALLAACRDADLVVSERRLPRRCTPRWLRLDRAVLRETGGVAISLAAGRVTTVLGAEDRHPWRHPPVIDTGGAESRRERGMRGKSRAERVDGDGS